MLSVCWGVVLNVCLKTKDWKKCDKLDTRSKKDNILEIDYYEKYLHHEPDCTKNHKWSSKIGLFLDYIDNILLF